MGDTDTRMSPGLCFLACLHLPTHAPWGDSQPQLLSLLPFCIERLNNAPKPKGYFYTSELCCPLSPLFLLNVQNDRADQLQKIFCELRNKCMWPTGLFYKRLKALLLLCAIMVATHSVTALWQQLLSVLMLSDVLLIIMNRLRSSMLLILESGAVGIRYVEKCCYYDHHSYSVWFSWWEAPSSKMKYCCLL